MAIADEVWILVTLDIIDSANCKPRDTVINYNNVNNDNNNNQFSYRSGKMNIVPGVCSGAALFT